MTVLMDVRSASVYFGKRAALVRALHDITLQIKAGERVALVGANGCGKSSMLRLLHGLMRPSSGVVHTQAGLRQAMVFQRPYMMRMSLQANLSVGLFLQGVPWRAARAQSLQALQHVGLAELAGRNARALSGGQQQRAALARACALAPQVLLLDEPTASLDPHAKHEVESLMQAFAAGRLNPPAAQGPMTMVFSSHNLGQVKRLASRVVYLENGSILADLPVEQFFDSVTLSADYPQAYLFVKGESP